MKITTKESLITRHVLHVKSVNRIRYRTSYIGHKHAFKSAVFLNIRLLPVTLKTKLFAGNTPLLTPDRRHVTHDLHLSVFY